MSQFITVLYLIEYFFLQSGKFARRKCFVDREVECSNKYFFFCWAEALEKLQE